MGGIPNSRSMIVLMPSGATYASVAITGIGGLHRRECGAPATKLSAMTNTEVNPATTTATGLFEAVSLDKAANPKKNSKTSRARRRTAKALAYFSLIFTGLLVLAEPWLLLPAVALVLAISLWD